MSSRHVSRMQAVQALFAADMTGALTLERVEGALADQDRSLEKGGDERPFTLELIRGVIANREALDGIIEKAAPDWPIDKVAPIDRTVLRLGLYEVLFGNNVEVPPKVALNEAVELAKTFGGDTSGSFVNGVLGTVYREREEHA